MEQVQLKATTTTTTGRGEFSAYAATYDTDRVKDRIIPGAFSKTIERWQRSDRKLPLHWNHESSAAGIVGAIDPDSMRETNEGLYVEGRLDLEGSATAREAWRAMKANVLGISFGYLAVDSRKSANGVRELLELDLFEVSLTSSPVNSEARFLYMKSSVAYPPTEDELRRQSRALGIDVPTTEELQRRKAAKAKLARDLRHRCWEVMLENAFGGPLPSPKPPPDPRAIARKQRERTEELRRECRRLGVKC